MVSYLLLLLHGYVYMYDGPSWNIEASLPLSSTSTCMIGRILSPGVFEARPLRLGGYGLSRIAAVKLSRPWQGSATAVNVDPLGMKAWIISVSKIYHHRTQHSSLPTAKKASKKKQKAHSNYLLAYKGKKR